MTPPALPERRRSRARTGRRAGPPPTHPAWGVAVFATVGLGMAEMALLLQALRSSHVPVLAVAGVAMAAAGGFFVKLARSRADSWRSWMTHGGLLTGSVCLGGLVLLAESSTTAVVYSSLFAWPIVFAGLYFRPRTVAVHVVLLVAMSTGTVVQQIGWPAALAGLVVTAPVYAGIAVICTSMATLLRTQASRDDLTGLLNRRGLEDAAERRAQFAALPGAGWSVVAIDLDGFKQVNDQFGHQAGDELLVQVARGWTGELRRHDVLARTGGDEFVVLLPGSTQEALGTVERLRARTPPEVGISAGVARWSVPRGLDEAIRRADIALYAAKHGGRGRTELADDPEGRLVPG